MRPDPVKVGLAAAAGLAGRRRVDRMHAEGAQLVAWAHTYGLTTLLSTGSEPMMTANSGRVDPVKLREALSLPAAATDAQVRAAVAALGTPQPSTPAWPWQATGEHPARWAHRTGRIVDEAAWRDRYDADPATIGPALAALTPVFDDRLRGLIAASERRAQADEDAELAEFDSLFPPHMRTSSREEAAEVDREGGEDFAEFDSLFRPGYRR